MNSLILNYVTIKFQDKTRKNMQSLLQYIQVNKMK